MEDKVKQKGVRAARFGLIERGRSRSPDRKRDERRSLYQQKSLSPRRRRHISPSSPRRIIKYRSINARLEEEAAQMPRHHSIGERRVARMSRDTIREIRDAREVRDARELISGGTGRAVRMITKENRGRERTNMEVTEDSSPGITEKKTRCSYWPNCKAGDTCPFVHPSEPCKHFPNCSFGDNCLYIHPAIPCKFQDKCQNPTCNYLHSSPAQLQEIGSFSTTVNPFHPPSAIACRFYPNCKNPQCPFMHPNPVICKFGANCQRPACPFTHPNNRLLVSKAFVNAPCRYGKNCAKPDCPFQHQGLVSPKSPSLSVSAMSISNEVLDMPLEAKEMLST